MHAFETFSIFKCIHRTAFLRRYTYSPFIILNQINNWQLLQHGKLECFTHFTFSYRCIAERAEDDRWQGLLRLPRWGSDPLTILTYVRCLI